jgi:hypothetical protein
VNPQQREAAERLVADQSSSNLEWSRQVVALLRELLAEPQGAPVAWWCKHPPEKGGGGFMTCDEAAAQHYMHKFRTVENGPVLVSLYAAPQQRKPLTPDQVYANDGIMACNMHIGALMNELMPFVRAVEKAHGITGEPT